MAFEALDNSGGGEDWFAMQAPAGGPAPQQFQANAAPAPTAPAGMPADYASAQQAFNQLFPGETLTPQMLQEHEAELKALGFTLRPNAAGVVGKIQWGNEPIVDVIQGAGSGLNRKQWLVPDGAAGGAMTGPGQFGGMVSPWTQAFNGGPAFQARDPNQIKNDPAYQFQLAQGLQGIERGAASKGTLLTGGTLKALEGYGQGLASTYNDKYYNRDVNEYKTAYDRTRSEYDLSRDIYTSNQDRPFDKFYRSATLGKPAA